MWETDVSPTGTIEIKVAAMPLFAEEQVVTLSPATEILNTPENPLISNETFRRLYLAMARLRRETSRPGHNSRNPRLHIGLNEAGIVGCTIDLSLEDTVLTLADRNSGHFLQDTNASAGGIDMPNSPLSISFATGMASLHTVQGKDRLVLAFVGAKQMAGSRTALKFAYDNRLPIIFVQLDASRNGTRPSKPRPSSTIPSMPVDKADVVAVYRVASEAIDKARRGAGPTIIECIDYRLTAAGKASQRLDPLIYMEEFLRKKNLWPEDLQAHAKVKPPSTARI